MGINIYNNASDIIDVKVSESMYAPHNYDVFIDRKEDAKKVFEVAPKKEELLKNIAVGSKMHIGDYEFIVLDHKLNNTTCVVCSDSIIRIRFGTNNCWNDSNIKKFLNEDFYYELCNSIDASDIILHAVSLGADDGTGEIYTDSCKVSLLSTNLYRCYRKYIPAFGDWWWTLTPVSYVCGYSQNVCDIHFSGALGWCDCRNIRGVRPFCVLNSNILVKI